MTSTQCAVSMTKSHITLILIQNKSKRECTQTAVQCHRIGQHYFRPSVWESTAVKLYHKFISLKLYWIPTQNGKKNLVCKSERMKCVVIKWMSERMNEMLQVWSPCTFLQFSLKMPIVLTNNQVLQFYIKLIQFGISPVFFFLLQTNNENIW